MRLSDLSLTDFRVATLAQELYTDESLKFLNNSSPEMHALRDQSSMANHPLEEQLRNNSKHH